MMKVKVQQRAAERGGEEGEGGSREE